MKQSDFYKVGADKRQDQVIKIGVNNYLLIFGYGIDEDGNGYNMRKNYDHKPTKAEIKNDVETLINGEIEKKILSGFEWRGIKVWLSLENQMNIKAAYDLAVQTNGERLPKKMKLGEDEDGRPVYHTFEDLEEFSDFFKAVVDYIEQVRMEGWDEKDGINYGEFGDGAD